MKNSFFTLRGFIFLCVSLSILAGCGGGDSKTTNNTSSAAQSSESPPLVLKTAVLKPDTSPDPALPTRPSSDWDKAADASRFLAQTTFGATAKDIDFVMKNGKAAWLDQQFATPATSQLDHFSQRLQDYGLQTFPNLMYGGDEKYTFERVIYQHHIWMETEIWGQDQLRARVAYALSQILVVSQFGANEFARETGFAKYTDVLMTGAFGNYEELLTNVTLNPIMGLYLSTLNNPKADESKYIHPDENYAREVLQLFSIGLSQLNSDGTLKLDAHGKPIPTYNQTTIKEFSRVFTGWTYSTYDTFAQNGAFTIYPSPISNTQPLKAFPDFHDMSSKTLLNGEIIPSNQTPEQDIKSAMHNIMSHDNVAPFICKKLIQYLVTSNPSNEYVARVAGVFNNNGSGVKGDMKSVVKAIYLDAEALTPPANASTYYGKLKDTPLAISGVWRAFKAQGVVVHGPETGAANTIAHHHYDSDEQEMLHAPTVFNYYQSDYTPPGTLAQKNLLAPEFEMFNGILAVHQTNLMENIIFHRGTTDKNIYTGAAATEATGFAVSYEKWNPIVKSLLNLDDEIKLANTPIALVDRINLLLAHGAISVEDSQLIADHISLLSDPLDRVYEAIFLIAISPEYAIQG